MPRDELTPTERRVLSFARSRWAFEALSTRVVTVADFTGWTRACACEYLRRLVRKGYMKRLPDRTYRPFGRMPK